MLEIDGSRGEGGGQIVRSALTLSAATGTPFRIFNIRAGRSKSGLLRQHLAATRAAASICAADVEGDTLGSAILVFRPGEISAGDYRFSVGSAGSTSLVAQTAIPILMLAKAPSTLHLCGGTHNPYAPPVDFLEHVYFPQLAKIGPRITVELKRYGFFPAGGGEVHFGVTPAPKLSGLHLLSCVGEAKHRVKAVVASIPRKVAEREICSIRRRTNWNEDVFEISVDTSSPGPGNVVMVRTDFENVSELTAAFGKPGLKAEAVARSALRDMRRYLASACPVGEHLADQLLLPMGLAAASGEDSSFKTHCWSQHCQTHVEVLEAFLPINVRVERNEASGVYSVHVFRC